ncbi:MAG: DnaJ domain-containing protein [Acidobacteria bacterium]|nr:DnaJ domain-containing protein [Acidobacteriota bacterium]
MIEVQGQLSEKPIASLIRALAKKNASGLLRISRGKTIKAIFFETGNPVFAISNAAHEQLEHQLVQDGLVSAAQIEEAKSQVDKTTKLSAVLIDKGLIAAEAINQIARQLVLNIIYSLFEWEQGEYLFDERMRASHDITIGQNVTDLLLEGGRYASRNEAVSQQLAPPEAVIERGDLDKEKLDSGKLVPLESYVLSRIETPTIISEVGAISGLPDGEAQRAVCALIASGFLKVVGEEKAEEMVNAAAAEEIEQVREEVKRKLQYSQSADYYEILEIPRQATSGEIKAAYYQLAKKYHPDRYRKVEDAELRNNSENLFAKITQAYETLSASGSRSTYNMKLRSGHLPKPDATSVPTSPLKTTPLAMPPLKPLTPSGDLNLQQSQTPSGSLPPQVTHTVVTETQHAPDPSLQKGAEYYYNQGRMRLERKEYHAAIHLLREAIKIDPSKAPYHFHLGNALIRNPRTRREADEHLAKAAELDPYNSQMRVKLGMLYKEMGLKKRAEHYFKDALSMDPENRAARKEVGDSEKKKKEDMPSLWKSDMGTIAKRLFRR